MLEHVVVAASCAFVRNIFIAAVVEQRRDTNRQSPVEAPEWLQGLTHDQLRELLQAKQHRSQAELLRMANTMRRLNGVRCSSSSPDTPALPLKAGTLEVA